MSRPELPEIGRFSVVGLINFGIDIAIFSIALYWLDIHLIVANTIAYSIATINSYLMNKYWTFAGHSTANISAAEFSRFLIFNIGGLALSNITVFFLTQFMSPILAKLAAVGVTFVWNYLTIRRFVFQKNNSATN